MAIVAMKHLRLLGMESEREALLNGDAALGVRLCGGILRCKLFFELLHLL